KGDVLDDGQSGGTKQRFHDVLVHARGGAEHARADVGYVGELEQSLDGAVLAEGAMQHGKNHVDIDGAVAGAAGERGGSLEWHQAWLAVNGFGRHHHRLPVFQYRGAGSRFRIACPQMPLFVRLSMEQALGMLGGKPAAVLGDADGYDFKLVLIDGVEDGCGREQRHFMLAAASPEQNADAKLFHHVSVWTGGTRVVNFRSGSESGGARQFMMRANASYAPGIEAQIVRYCSTRLKVVSPFGNGDPLPRFASPGRWCYYRASPGAGFFSAIASESPRIGRVISFG